MTLVAFADKAFSNLFRYFWRDNRGATAVEYGLIAGGIALAIIAAVFVIGDDLSSLFNTSAEAVSSGNAKAN